MRRWLALAFAVAVLAAQSAVFAETRLIESGSSLMFPLMQLWAQEYHRAHGDVEIVPNNTGSGIGIADAIDGKAQIGASDAYMSDAAIAKTPMLNIPLAISAQQVNYNFPGFNDVHLHLSGPVLAGIYDGSVQYWDDDRIVSINRDLAKKLPHQAIVPIHRSDGSGDTFIFTQYLSATSPEWKRGPGFGTQIAWPGANNGVSGVKNGGMLQQCRDIPYSISYIGISFLDQTNAVHLGYAALLNDHGQYVLPTAESIEAAAAALVSKTPRDGRISLVNSSGPGAYPLVNFEYAIVRPHQNDKETATHIADFLKWVVSPGGGNARDVLRRVHFVPLPGSVRPISEAQIAEIR